MSIFDWWAGKQNTQNETSKAKTTANKPSNWPQMNIDQSIRSLDVVENIQPVMIVGSSVSSPFINAQVVTVADFFKPSNFANSLGGTLWTPASGKSIVLIGGMLTANAAAATPVTFTDGTLSFICWVPMSGQVIFPSIPQGLKFGIDKALVWTSALNVSIAVLLYGTEV